MLVKGDL